MKTLKLIGAENNEYHSLVMAGNGQVVRFRPETAVVSDEVAEELVLLPGIELVEDKERESDKLEDSEKKLKVDKSNTEGNVVAKDHSKEVPKNTAPRNTRQRK